MIKRQENPIKRIPGVDKAFMDVLLNAMAENPRTAPRPRNFGINWRSSICRPSQRLGRLMSEEQRPSPPSPLTNRPQRSQRRSAAEAVRRWRRGLATWRSSH